MIKYHSVRLELTGHSIPSGYEFKATRNGLLVSICSYEIITQEYIDISIIPLTLGSCFITYRTLGFAQRRGFCTEAVQSMIDHIIPFNHKTIVVERNNPASLKVVNKLAGFNADDKPDDRLLTFYSTSCSNKSSVGVTTQQSLISPLSDL